MTLIVVDDNGASDNITKEITIINTAPTIDIIEPNIQLFEGETHVFTANSSDTPSDFPLLDYAWSFGKTGWNASYLAFDDGIYTYDVTATDLEGLNALDQGEIQVSNVEPKVSISSANVIGNITIRMTGTPNNTYLLRYLENGNVIANYSHPRVAGNPNSQAETFPINFNVNNDNKIELTNISTDVTVGANPTWVTFSFSDGNEFTLYHVFNHAHGNSLNWTISLDDLYDLMSLTIKGSVFDPGLVDEISGTILYDGEFLSNFSNSDIKGQPDYAGITEFSALLSPFSGLHTINVSVWDDDGGYNATSLSLMEDNDIITFDNLAPDVALFDGSIFEDSNKTFSSSVTDWQNEQFFYTWSFGDGTLKEGEVVNHAFSNEGTYLVSVEVSDGQKSTIMSYLQEVSNKIPDVDIIGVFTGSEDQELSYIPYISESSSDKDSLRYYWEFGDSIIATGTEVTHSWARSGLHDLTLKVLDDNGAMGSEIMQVNISDLPPVIEGKYGFEGPEGTVIVLDVQAHDSIVDEPTLHYYWQVNGFNFTGKKPTMWSDDCNYTANLTVIDQDGFQADFANISVYFINSLPIIHASSFISYGVSQDISFKAQAVDSFVDMNDLTYTWTMDGAPIPDGSGIYSSVPWTAETTGLFTGTVIVTDDSESSSDVQFQVAVTMDEDGDGISDEEEFILNLSPDDADTDDDWITDWYEINVYNTSPYLADTDGDGLADGFDVMLGAGELTLGTDPRHNDTDRDNLTDGFEVLGWHIEDPLNNSNIIHVQSNPLKLDSDDDNLTDWEEWYYWTELGIPLDPKNQDTDGNGIPDREQVGLGIKYDSDGDGLTDAQELGKIIAYIPAEQVFLAEESSWENAQEILGELDDTKEYNMEAYSGFREDIYTRQDFYQYMQIPPFYGPWTWVQTGSLWLPSEPPFTPTSVIFHGEFIDLSRKASFLRLKFDMTAQDFDGDLLLFDHSIEDWVSVETYSGDEIREIIFPITEEDVSRWINEDGMLKFKLISGVTIIEDEPTGSYPIIETNFHYKSELKLYFASWSDAAQDLMPVYANHSDPNKADTDDDGLNDYEEWYPADDGFITDPRNNDTDADGLLDSAESYTTINDMDERYKIEGGQWNTFPLETSAGFSAVNTSVTISISIGEEGTEANLDLRVKMNDELLFTNSTQNTRYYCNITEVGKIVEEKVGSFTGTWTLEVHADRDCMLEDFKVDITQRLNPLKDDFDGDGILDGHELNPEINGWITNPRLNDSDGDGWSDYYEINVTSTNPNSRDTDGDTVPDAQDVNPLQNVIIKVTILKGHDGGAWYPYHLLAMVMNVEDQVVVTTYQPYTLEYQEKWVPFLWWSILVYAWYTTAAFSLDYYFDVPDNEATVAITASLWRMVGYPNIGEKAMDATNYYTLNPDGPATNIKQWAGSSYVEYDVTTLGLDHVNTIAVHENGSFHGDHYPAIERMNAIILDVTHQDGNYPMFEQGINVILMPTSLFVNSKLHAIIEQAVDASGQVNMSKIPTCLQGADFSSMNRDSDSVSKNVESLITKAGISPEEAWEILQLCLISANATEGEIYLFKVVEASLLGLAQDVLALIPLDGSIMQNSAQGTMPVTLSQAWEQFWGYVGVLLLGVLVAIALLLLLPFILVVLIGILIFGVFGEEIMAAIEAVIKAFILFFIYVILALCILVLIIGIALVALTHSIGILIVGGTVSYGVNYFEGEIENNSVYIGFSIENEYNEFLELDIPFISFQIKNNGLEFLNIDLNFFTFTANTNYENENNAFSSLKFEANNENQNNQIEITVEWSDFFDGLALSMGIFGSFIGIATSIMFFAKWSESIISIVVLGMAIGLAIFSFFVFGHTLSWYIGLAVGCMAVFLGLVATTVPSNPIGIDPASFLGSMFPLIMSIISVVLSAVGIIWLNTPEASFILNVVQVIISGIILWIALKETLYIREIFNRSALFTLFLISSLFLSFFTLGIALSLALSDQT